MVRYSVLKGMYEIERTIGCGGFAKVKLATHIATGEKVAIKIMDKNALRDDLPRVKLELKALKTLSHKHISKLYEVIETETHVFIVVEYCSGGELFDHIVEKNRLTESESRRFFRQIVSAVAYLHSLGYAHRDLKPENVLLDKDQSLKLIDFGLCAKPEGGMETPLKTSCGSPTYAAPELVLGKQYLGQEVDVWAMGVLLYALLAGFLPFDDQNIDSLYKKILSGKYHEPSFMSQESKNLIRSMLQVEPNNRIKVGELLSHPWITMGIFDPVEVISEHTRKQDDDCVALMAQFSGISSTDMWRHLRKWRYDYHTSTYLLLLNRKNRGSPLRINPAASRIRFGLKTVNAVRSVPRAKPSLKPLDVNGPPDMNVGSPKTPRTPISADSTYKRFDGENLYPLSTQMKDVGSPSANFVEPRCPSAIRKPQKRLRSPTLDSDFSPVPAKKATPGTATAKTPDRKRTPGSAETPARRVLGSIGRSLHKVRNVLTPKKSVDEINNHPTVLASKDLCNVSTTECNDPEFVITELMKALEKKGIHCHRKGFAIRGKMEPDTIHRFGGCSFELEICYLPAMIAHKSSENATPTQSILKAGVTNNVENIATIEVSKGAHSVSAAEPSLHFACIGIRRKRLKGDSWCYKKVCEQVLALTTTELKQPIESAV